MDKKVIGETAGCNDIKNCVDSFFNIVIAKDLTKGLTRVQKRVFMDLTGSRIPMTAYELGLTRMDTMHILENKRFVKRVPYDRLGTVFSPTTSIRWISRYRYLD